LKLFFAWYLAKDNKNVQVITHPILSMGFEGCSFRVVYIRTENLKRITFRARTEKAAYKKRDDGLAKRKRDLREAVIESVVYRPLKSECDFIVSYFFPKTSKKKK
jgi:hypothetical protein